MGDGPWESPLSRFWLHHPVQLFLSGSGRLPMVRSRVMVGSGADDSPARRVARVDAGVWFKARLMKFSLQNHIGGVEVNLQG